LVIVTDTVHADDPGLVFITVAPKVFLSYRRTDTGDVAAALSERLREDLGSTSVFRDEEDLIGGRLWRDVLADTIAGSDATLFLIGNEWTGVQPDGSRRIDEPTDVVRGEVRYALEDRKRRVPVPILIDTTEPPTPLPGDVAPLFEHHVVKARRENLHRGASVDYQEVLVSVWEAFRARVERGVLLVGATHAGAHVEALVAQLKGEGAIAARELSRFASGAVIVSARRASRGHRRWPQVIVVVERGDENDETFAALLAALYRHPAITSVALVGVGAAAGMAATITGLASGATGSGTTVTTHTVPELAASLPHAGSGATGALSTSWANSATGTKFAVAAGSLAAAAAGGFGLKALIDDGNTQPIAFAATTGVSAANDPELQERADEGLYPLGQPEAAVVRLGSPQPVGDRDGDGVEDVSRQVSVQFGGLDEPVGLGAAILPTSLSGQSGEASDAPTTEQVAAISQTLELPAIAGMPTSVVCFNEDDPSEPWAGWRFTGNPITVTTRFDVVTDAGEFSGTQIVVVLKGPARREPLAEAPPDRNYGPECPEDLPDAIVRLASTGP
jgi:hypothetical protein